MSLTDFYCSGWSYNVQHNPGGGTRDQKEPNNLDNSAEYTISA